MLRRKSPLQRRRDVERPMKEKPRTHFPRHCRYVKKHVCVGYERDRARCQGPINLCHIHGRHGDYDYFTFSACGFHHLAVDHAKGRKALEALIGKSVLRISIELAESSPDFEMRRAMEEHRQREPWLFEA